MANINRIIRGEKSANIHRGILPPKAGDTVLFLGSFHDRSSHA
jgi:hypothetical protein